MKKILTHLSIAMLTTAGALSQQIQYPSGPFPWNEAPTGVSFSNLTLYSISGEYNLGGDWYHSDNEDNWLTLEKAYSSTEGGSHDSWILTTFTENGVDFDIYNGAETPTWKKYKYVGPSLSELELDGYYEWKIGPNGYNDFVPTPPPFPVVATLNLGESMAGQDYIKSYLPNADFSFPIVEGSTEAFINEAKELNIGLTFEDGQWVPER
jgi:hypothetical protein